MGVAKVDFRSELRKIDRMLKLNRFEAYLLCFSGLSSRVAILAASLNSPEVGLFRQISCGGFCENGFGFSSLTLRLGLY
jgi:hypothetical protein